MNKLSKFEKLIKALGVLGKRQGVRAARGGFKLREIVHRALSQARKAGRRIGRSGPKHKKLKDLLASKVLTKKSNFFKLGFYFSLDPKVLKARNARSASGASNLIKTVGQDLASGKSAPAVARAQKLRDIYSAVTPAGAPKPAAAPVDTSAIFKRLKQQAAAERAARASAKTAPGLVGRAIRRTDKAITAADKVIAQPLINAAKNSGSTLFNILRKGLKGVVR